MNFEFNNFELTACAVLFDMDGVLFDSMPNHAYAWSHAMTQFGLEMTAYEAYLHEGRTGNGTIDILTQRYWGRDATEEEIFTAYLDSLPLTYEMIEERMVEHLSV